MADELEQPVVKTFTQDELDRIIAERLHREKTKNENEMREYNELLSELTDFGYTGSVQDVKALIRSQKEEVKKQQEYESLQSEASQSGTSPELLAEMRELKKELEVIKAERLSNEKALKEKKEQEEKWEKNFNEFTESFPNVDLNKLNDNQKFIKFIKNKNGTLKELYEDFVELVGETEAEIVARTKSKDLRSTSSGKTVGASDSGASYGLTDNQKRLAKENDMTYKEYAEAMKIIKK